jgi:hypothetical protein
MAVLVVLLRQYGTDPLAVSGIWIDVRYGLGVFGMLLLAHF